MQKHGGNTYCYLRQLGEDQKPHKTYLGRLFEKGYSINFGEKCYWYLQAGFILGKNFFVTSDDIEGGTDSRAIEQVVSKVQRLFYGY